MLKFIFNVNANLRWQWVFKILKLDIETDFCFCNNCETGCSNISGTRQFFNHEKSSKSYNLYFIKTVDIYAVNLLEMLLSQN